MHTTVCLACMLLSSEQQHHISMAVQISGVLPINQDNHLMKERKLGNSVQGETNAS